MSATDDDAAMTDRTSTETGDEKKGDEAAATEEKVESNPANSSSSVLVLSQVEAAAYRLERLLGGIGGGASSNASATNTNSNTNSNANADPTPPLPPFHYSYTNPRKIIRRWLGTSSGAAGAATMESIQSAAAKLLDPDGVSSTGRSLLLSSSTINADAKLPLNMQVEDAREVETMKMDEQKEEENHRSPMAPSTYLSASAREVESWLISVAVRLLWKEGKYSQAVEWSQQAIALLLNQLDEASLHIASRRAAPASSLFPLLARMYRLRALAAEALNDPGVLVSLRVDTARAHNAAAMRRDVDTTATLLNCLLRDMLRHKEVEQANKLLNNCSFPTETAGNNQLCRFLYYSGQIQALRLEYTVSFGSLSQCLRKAATPTNTSDGCLGFRIAAQRLLIVVQLLMGDIPERHVFDTAGMKMELAPYLAITSAVRQGDLDHFEKVVSNHMKRIVLDGTHTLISRLAHQVVKAGLRKLSISYSRLSLQDVADRLGLPSATSAEYVVAKAVRDGVLDATIFREEGFVQSHDLVDVYATKEPAEAFHRRIAYCLTTHNDAVKGMRYPPDAYKKQLEASRGYNRRKKDEKTDEEKAQDLEDELDEDY